MHNQTRTQLNSCRPLLDQSARGGAAASGQQGLAQRMSIFLPKQRSLFASSGLEFVVHLSIHTNNRSTASRDARLRQRGDTVVSAGSRQWQELPPHTRPERTWWGAAAGSG